VQDVNAYDPEAPLELGLPAEYSVLIVSNWSASIRVVNDPDERLSAEHAAILARIRDYAGSVERRLSNDMRFTEPKVPNSV
jgi:hypothetical protein